MAQALYQHAGVDIDAGNRAVSLMKEAVRSTYSSAVLADVGSFGGLFALESLPPSPVLVASTDGVGTKVRLAAEAGRWRTIGHDIVNHCINDILVQGARPLFFLDYLATSKLVPEVAAEVVTGMAEACRAAGCALLGGETAEMPGVYAEGALDVAGTIVGIVGRDALLPRSESMQAGDLVLALPSSGPHTNGYSLIRRVVVGRDLTAPVPGDAQDVALLDALLAPHRCYLAEVNALLASGVPLLGLAHVTGGGLIENVPRVLPERLDALLDLSVFPPPPLFRALVEWSGMNLAEAYRVFNMGVGMVLIVADEEGILERVQAIVPEAKSIGRLVAGTGRVHLAGLDVENPA